MTLLNEEHQESTVGQLGVEQSLGEQPSVVTPVGMTFGLVICVAMLSSLITFGGGMVAYDHFLAQKVVCVDIKGFIQEQQVSYLAGKLTDDQLKVAFDRMEAVIKTIPKNKVVLMGDAVIQGVEKIEILPKSSATK